MTEDRDRDRALSFEGKKVVYELPLGGIDSHNTYGLREVRYNNGTSQTQIVLESRWLVSIMPFSEPKVVHLDNRLPIHLKKAVGGTKYTLPSAGGTYETDLKFVAIPVFSSAARHSTWPSMEEPGAVVTIEPNTAERVGKDLVTVLSTNLRSASGGLPGIDLAPLGIRIPGTSSPKVVWTPEFTKFIERLAANQNVYMRDMVSSAEAAFRERGLAGVHPGHKLAASWLYGAGAAQFAWYKTVDVLNSKNCAACNVPMDTHAMMCQTCKTNLLKFYLDPDNGIDEQWVAANDPLLLPRYKTAMDRLTKPAPTPVVNQPPPSPVQQQQGRRG